MVSDVNNSDFTTLVPQKMKDHGRTWKRFKQSRLNYSIASAVNEKEENVKVATFLHVAGEEAMEKYELRFPVGERG